MAEKSEKFGGSGILPLGQSNGRHFDCFVFEHLREAFVFYIADLFPRIAVTITIRPKAHKA